MSHPMFHDNDEDSDTGITLKPKPHRPFELTSPPTSRPSSPSATEQSFPSHLQAPAPMSGSTTPSRTRSLLNLTSSTLFGIYEPTGFSPERDTTYTPWGTGAQTPAESPVNRTSEWDWSKAKLPDTTLHNGTNGTKLRRKSAAPSQQRVHHMPRKGFKGYFLPLLGRTIALFGVGVSYALLITHLHDRRGLAPARVDLNRSSSTYLFCWGLAGILLGSALPWADTFWADSQKPQRKNISSGGLDSWMSVIRSISAFIGIAFAIRKLPWASPLQLSLTLALANPAVWYLIDRSPPGFIVSSIFAVGGTMVLLGINPALVPSPTTLEVLRGLVARNGGGSPSAGLVEQEGLVLGIFSEESVGVATWIASVFFVSAVCFGNIGRRLAPQRL